MGRGGGTGGRRSGGRSSGRRSFGGRSSSGGRGGGFRSRGRISRGGSFRSGGRRGGGRGGGGALEDLFYRIFSVFGAVHIFILLILLFGMVALLFFAIAMGFIPSLESWFEDSFAVVMIGCGVFGFVLALPVCIRFVFPRIVKPAFSINADIEKAYADIEKAYADIEKAKAEAEKAIAEEIKTPESL